MTGLNAILSGTFPSVAGVSGSPNGTLAPQVREQPAPGGQDIFEQGQWWKNRALSQGEEADRSSCRCGNCPLCAAGAYRLQQQGSAPSSPLGAEERGASATRSPPLSENEAAGEQTGAAGDDPAETAGLSLNPQGSDGKPLDRTEMMKLAELKRVDANVRAHEQAHLAAAGGLAKGGASFSYRKGPDGLNYAVGGEVQIDTSPGATPQETMTKMVKVRAAALAPADPSPQDRKVAAAAASVMGRARQEQRIIELESRAEQLKNGEGSAVRDQTEGGRTQSGEPGREDMATASNAVQESGSRPRTAVRARVASLYGAVQRQWGGVDIST